MSLTAVKILFLRLIKVGGVGDKSQKGTTIFQNTILDSSKMTVPPLFALKREILIFLGLTSEQYVVKTSGKSGERSFKVKYQNKSP